MAEAQADVRRDVREAKDARAAVSRRCASRAGRSRGTGCPWRRARRCGRPAAPRCGPLPPHRALGRRPAPAPRDGEDVGGPWPLPRRSRSRTLSSARQGASIALSVGRRSAPDVGEPAARPVRPGARPVARPQRVVRACERGDERRGDRPRRAPVERRSPSVSATVTGGAPGRAGAASAASGRAGRPPRRGARPPPRPRPRRSAAAAARARGQEPLEAGRSRRGG